MVRFPSKPLTEAALAASWGVKPQPVMKIRRFTPHRNGAGTMLGFVSIELPSGMILHSRKLMIGPQGKHWIALPSERQVDRDGKPALDINGKVRWNPIVEFADKATRDRFQDQILTALRPSASRGARRGRVMRKPPGLDRSRGTARVATARRDGNGFRPRRQPARSGAP